MGAKLSACVQLQYISFAALGTILHWKGAELLMFEVDVKNMTWQMAGRWTEDRQTADGQQRAI